MTWNQRYKHAYEAYHARQYPTSTRDFGCPLVKYPAVGKANGLTMMVCNFLKWEGHRSTRINTQGQFVNEKYKGQVVSTGFRTSSTRRGTADISATIRGRAVMLEIKAGQDRPSEYQLAEQIRERAAGGVYEFIYNAEQFLSWYDQFLLSLK